MIGFCFLLLFLFCCVCLLCFRLHPGVDSGLRNGPRSSFDSPRRDADSCMAQFVHQHKHCVTTWREPKRRRTEKKLWQASWICGAKPCDVIPQKMRNKHQTKQETTPPTAKGNRNTKTTSKKKQTHPQTKTTKTVE